MNAVAQGSDVAVRSRSRREVLWIRIVRAGSALAGIALAAVAVFALLHWLPDTSPLGVRVSKEDAAELTAAAALLLLTGVLYFAGGRRYVANEPFAVEDPKADERTIKEGEPVPDELRKLPKFNEDLDTRTVVTVPLHYYEGGTPTEVLTWDLLDEEAVKQSGGRVRYRWVAKKDIPYTDPAAPWITVDAGEEVPAGLLAAFEGNTRDVAIAVASFDYTADGTTHHVPAGKQLTPDEATQAGDRKKTVKVAKERKTIRDPGVPEKQRAKGDDVPPSLLGLPEFAGEVEQKPFATAPFSYRKGGTAKSVAAGEPLPEGEDAERAAGENVASQIVAGKDVTYRAYSFAQGATVPAEIARTHVQASPRQGIWLRALIVGKDGRWSTSKAQALMWTYIVCFIVLALLFAAVTLGVDLTKDAGTDGSDLNKSVDFGELSLPDAYYILLGGPFAAAILAKAFTTSKTENGTLVKSESSTTSTPAQGIAELVSDDGGDTDLVDFQYLLFNLIAAGVVLAAFIPHLTKGFPEVPEILFGLTSASALAYTAKKGVERSIASITSVSPSRLRPGALLDIFGRNLLVGDRRLPRILIGGRDAGTPELVPSEGGDVQHLRVRVPRDLEGQPTALVTATPDGGSTTDPVEIQLVDIGVTSVQPQPIRIGSTPRIVISGAGFSVPVGTVTALTLGGVALEARVWGPTQIIAALDPKLTYPAGEAVVLEVHAGETVAATTVLVEAISIERVRPAPVKLSADEDIVVEGAGLGDAELTAALDGKPLDVVSRSDKLLVVRLIADRVKAGDYRESTAAALTLRAGGYEASATVAVAKPK